MTAQLRIALAGAGSAALLLGALAFQYLGGLPPCPLCIWQRWPHLAAVLLAVLGVTLLRVHARAVALLGGIAALTTAGVALYHTGIEREWWSGPDTCTSGDITNLTGEQLMAQIMAAPLVRCDEVAWELLGLSMASWNGILSLALALLWLTAARRTAS
jgi:disulfide bond formation protein DsbB